MKIIEPSATIIDDIDGEAILRKIEYAARTCYQSYAKAGDGTAERLVASCIKHGHHSILEHVSVSVKFVTDRAVHNELVRHRMTAVSAESTRYCNYGKDGITVIKPYWYDSADVTSEEKTAWCYAMRNAEEVYQKMVNDFGMSPEMARAVLPLSLKCEYVITANLRELRHIFQLRCSPAAHPEVRRVMLPLLAEFKRRIPVVFDDIVTAGENVKADTSGRKINNEFPQDEFEAFIKSASWRDMPDTSVNPAAYIFRQQNGYSVESLHDAAERAKELGKVKTQGGVESAPERKEIAVDGEQELDNVSHPAHYTAGSVECIDAIEAAISSIENPVEAFLTGQVLKYVWRYKLKNGLEDLRKAQWYLDRLIGKEEQNCGKI